LRNKAKAAHLSRFFIGGGGMANNIEGIKNQKFGIEIEMMPRTEAGFCLR